MRRTTSHRRIRRTLFTSVVALMLLAGIGLAVQSALATRASTEDNPQVQAPSHDPDITTERTRIISVIEEYKIRANRFYDLMWGLLHITILIVCIVLIRSTAMATTGARFMRCFINSYAITASFYVGKILMPYFLAYIAKNTPTAGVSLESLKLSVLQLREIDYMWSAIDSFLSLFSSFFLLMGWHLLRRYPKESIARGFYAGLNMIFVAIVAPLLTGVLLLRQPDPLQDTPNAFVFLLVDTFAAGVAICLFGWELWRRMRPQKSQRVRTWLRRFWPALSSPILIVFFLWGGAQPAYVWFRREALSHWYFGCLLVLKLLAGISVVIAASTTLKERPAFRTESSSISQQVNV